MNDTVKRNWNEYILFIPIPIFYILNCTQILAAIRNISKVFVIIITTHASASATATAADSTSCTAINWTLTTVDNQQFVITQHDWVNGIKWICHFFSCYNVTPTHVAFQIPRILSSFVCRFIADDKHSFYIYYYLWSYFSLYLPVDVMISSGFSELSPHWHHFHYNTISPIKVTSLHTISIIRVPL